MLKKSVAFVLALCLVLCIWIVRTPFGASAVERPDNLIDQIRGAGFDSSDIIAV